MTCTSPMQTLEHYGSRTCYSSRWRLSSLIDTAHGQRRFCGPSCLTLLAYHRLCLDNTSRFLRNPPKTLPSAQSGNQKNISAYCIYANSLLGSYVFLVSLGAKERIHIPEMKLHSIWLGSDTKPNVRRPGHYKGQKCPLHSKPEVV